MGKKCLLLLLQEAIGELSAPEPEWWDKKHHPLPGGGVFIQEEGWGSIAAFTLRCVLLVHELSNASFNWSTSATSVLTTNTGLEATVSPLPSTPPAGLAGTTKHCKFFSNSAQVLQQPDPKDDAIWHESDTYAAIVTRKEVARDSASSPSIRDMLRSRMPAEIGTSGSRTAPLATPLSAWAKPDVQLSMEAAGGEVTGLPDTVGSAGKTLQGLEAFSMVDVADVIEWAVCAEIGTKEGKEVVNEEMGKERQRSKIRAVIGVCVCFFFDSTIFLKGGCMHIRE